MTKSKHIREGTDMDNGLLDQVVKIKTRSIAPGACFAYVVRNGEKIYETPAFAYGANSVAYEWAKQWCEEHSYPVDES